jgi:hypothetical protein
MVQIVSCMLPVTNMIHQTSCSMLHTVPRLHACLFAQRAAELHVCTGINISMRMNLCPVRARVRIRVCSLVRQI